MIARPSSLPTSTGSTASPSASGAARSRSSPLTRAAITVDLGPAAGSPPQERVAGRSARVHHVLASGEGDVKLLGRHGGLPG